jgi:hypothetical protein
MARLEQMMQEEGVALIPYWRSLYPAFTPTAW